MSDIVELAYTLLLGWMSALTDWLWALLSGGGGGRFLAWFLERWKVWLVILIAGGLIVDWLMHIIRWQPYKVWFRRPVPDAPASPEPVQWDRGEGYYDENGYDGTDYGDDGEVLAEDAAEWTDLTLPMLSEIDENWAQPALEPETAPQEGWEPTRIGGLDPQPYEEENEEQFADTNVGYYYEEDETAPDVLNQEPEEEYVQPLWQEEPLQEQETLWAEDAATFEEEEPAENPSGEESGLEETQVYGTRGFWPGQGMYAYEAKNQNPAESDEEPESAPAEEANASSQGEEHARRRRRRGFRQSEREEAAAFEWSMPQRAQEQQSRETLVTPRMQEWLVQEDKRGVQTVTGRPAVRRGLLRFSMTDEEPIAGLPPMRVEGGGFHPAARPDNPDFETDRSGEE